MGSKGVVRRIKMSSAAKLYIWGIGTLYELCVPSTPLNPMNPPNLAADFHSKVDFAVNPWLLVTSPWLPVTRYCNKQGAVL